MSVATGAGETNEFATLLRQLKDRSGLSYGALAKRLHMSTSTLHRYCNGTAVPNEYAPVERLARVCRATPEELMELHRRWILADAARDRRAEQAAAARAGAAAAEAGAAAPGTEQAAPLSQAAEAGAGAETETETGTGTGTGTEAGTGAEAGTPAKAKAETDGNGDLVVTDLPRTPAPAPPSRRRRHALIAAVTVAAVLGAVVLAVDRPWDGGNGGGSADGKQRAVGATGTTAATTTGTAATATPPATPSSTAPSRTPSTTPSATRTGGAAPATRTGDGEGDGKAPPVSVDVHPYVRAEENPCSQHFLVDAEPSHMGPPASEQDSPRWAAAYGAVSSDEQRLSLTVQGTGSETVVLEALHVRIVSKAAPLAWNDYAMAVGCGGNVGTADFGVDLDKGSPHLTPENGQRDFPYSVSESDPEVFRVTATTKAYDVRWDLLLDWSSGTRHGTLHIDNKGVPFRTSADVNRPGYDYPPGYTDWIKREGG
ncbi:helix-turn-helix domain-containing protein [Streptomyces sp. NPDC008317]|uniref:helix-turn-helix domain-containing protein n=1 Tax=Streptomyces sp. NPDC008317 TaxID=3364827 RepID=UPI0036E1EF3B